MTDVDIGVIETALLSTPLVMIDGLGAAVSDAGVVGVMGTTEAGVVGVASLVVMVTGFSISGKLNGFPVLSLTAVVEP